MDGAFNLLETLSVISHHVHLVDGEYHVPDSHQIADTGVASGLNLNALGGVDEDDGELRKGSRHGHVSGVFLMSRSVGYNVAARLRFEIAVGHIDGDALFPLAHEPVQQQRIVDLTVRAANPAVQLQRLLLIRIELLAVIKHVSDQRGFSVVHAAAGKKFQQILHQKYPSLFLRSMLPAASWSITRLVRSE